MPQGGRLVIGGSCVTGANLPKDLAPGRYICLTVSDTGAGMDAATLKRATDPFFTTKGAGKGTGLGLSMVPQRRRAIGRRDAHHQPARRRHHRRAVAAAVGDGRHC